MLEAIGLSTRYSGSVALDFWLLGANGAGQTTTWRAWFIPKVVKRVKLTALDIDNLPAFEFREEPFPEVARRVLTSLASLLLQVLLYRYLSYKILRRYSVAA